MNSRLNWLSTPKKPFDPNIIWYSAKEKPF